jgi:hypothetical protein
MWQWLVKKGYFKAEIIDLKDFNRWIKRHRAKGEYCSKTLKAAFNDLVKHRVINVVKGITWNVAKIVTRPLEYLKVRKKVQRRDIFSNIDRSKYSNSDDVVSQQQHIRVIDNHRVFLQHGIHFDETELEVLDRPRNEILLSIACYEIADETRVTQGNQLTVTRGKVENPPGWIRACLRRRFWDKPDTYRQLVNRYGHTTYIFELFPEMLDPKNAIPLDLNSF